MQPVLSLPPKEKGNTHAWYLRITTLAKMMGTVVRTMKITTTILTTTRTWLTAGPPTVVQASSRATKGKMRSRCRSRSIGVREEMQGVSRSSTGICVSNLN